MKVSVEVQTDISEMIYQWSSSTSTSSLSRSSSAQDLLAAWEDLLGWSENAAAARKLQEEMIILKHTLHRLGNKSSFELLDTEPSIEIAIEALKAEKAQLQTYRTQMLRLNASVHSWLTRQERKLQTAVEEAAIAAAAAASASASASTSATTVTVASATATFAATAATSVFKSIDTKIDNSVNSVINKMPETTEPRHHQQQNVTSAGLSVGVGNNKDDTDMKSDEMNVVTLVPTSGALIEQLQATEKATQLDTLVHSESEFHKHLKDEVSDMYSAWDEADARINNQLEMLTTSLIAWRQLECGLSEFHQVLGKDRGTLQGLEGALNKGQATPNELAQNVKLVAKLLSEKVSVSQEQLTSVQGPLDPNHIVHITKFTASNGSLSDSGISDGGATSDGGLSERERRLGVLRRLAKQLESALAPGSEAMKSIAARMESAEAELKHLQNTCRDLIVRTAATQQNKQKLLEAQQQNENDMSLRQEEDVEDVATAIRDENGVARANGSMLSTSSLNDVSRRNKRDAGSKERNSNDSVYTNGTVGVSDNHKKVMKSRGSKLSSTVTAPDGGDDPASDPDLEFELDKPEDNSEKSHKNGWAWRIAKAALPMQMALFTFLCAACLMQPNCCDNLNNFSMSFTPQLRYIRGPPPI